MERRNFLKQTAVATAALYTGLPASAFALSGAAERITILHTNDMHSRIDPFPTTDRRNADRGGMARRASLVQQIRQEAEHVLLLDAGDIFQGTPYFNFFGGELEFKLMSQMGYDAATMGNHDFDAGIPGFIKQLPHAQFPFLVANYTFENEVLRKAIAPYKIFKKGKIRVGVFGLGIELEGLVADDLYEGTRYLDPVGVAREMVEELTRQRCDLIVCLSHLGNQYDGDKVSDHSLAAQVAGIDLIIGGHTHTFMDAPSVVQSPEGHQTIIHQVGFAGLRLGRIDFTFEKGKKTARLGSNHQDI